MMKWSYKTVHFELKKEGILGSGFLDESEIEQELNEYGRSGWDLVSVLEVHDGMIAFFKQPFGLKQSAHSAGGETVFEDEIEPPAEVQPEMYEAEDDELDFGGSEEEEVIDNRGIGAIRIE